MHDVQPHITLGQLCIEKAKVSVCIDHVLSNQYSVFGNKSGTKSDTTLMFMPNAPKSSYEDLVMWNASKSFVCGTMVCQVTIVSDYMYYSLVSGYMIARFCPIIVRF